MHLSSLVSNNSRGPGSVSERSTRYSEYKETTVGGAVILVVTETGVAPYHVVVMTRPSDMLHDTRCSHSSGSSRPGPPCAARVHAAVPYRGTWRPRCRAAPGRKGSTGW
jgi:hypothetical protein